MNSLGTSITSECRDIVCARASSIPRGLARLEPVGRDLTRYAWAELASFEGAGTTADVAAVDTGPRFGALQATAGAPRLHIELTRDRPKAGGRAVGGEPLEHRRRLGARR